MTGFRHARTIHRCFPACVGNFNRDRSNSSTISITYKVILRISSKIAALHKTLCIESYVLRVSGHRLKYMAEHGESANMEKDVSFATQKCHFGGQVLRYFFQKHTPAHPPVPRKCPILLSKVFKFSSSQQKKNRHPYRRLSLTDFVPYARIPFIPLARVRATRAYRCLQIQNGQKLRT